MPLTVPSGALTKANWVTPYLKPLVDANETAAATAQSAADAAGTLAAQKYTKPGAGIPETDLDTATRAKLAPLYLDGVVFSGTLPSSGSLLQAPLRIADATTVRLFEIRLTTAPTGGGITFELRKLSGTSALVTVGTVTVAAGSKVGRVDPGATFAEGDLLDLWLLTNASSTASATVSATVHNRAGAVTATGPAAVAAGISDSFSRIDNATTMGLTETGSKTWTPVAGAVWGVLAGRAYSTAAAGGPDQYVTLQTDKINMDVSVRLSKTTSNYASLLVSYVDASNFVYVELQPGGELVFRKRVAGVETNFPTTLGTADMALIRLVRTNANQYTLYRDGIQVQQTDTTQTMFSTSTLMALRAGRFGSDFVTFDDVAVAA